MNQIYKFKVIKNLIKNYDIVNNFKFPTLKKKAKPKKGELIRIKNINSSSTFPYVRRGMIFEYLLLEVVTNLLSSDKEKQVFYYYTLSTNFT